MAVADQERARAELRGVASVAEASVTAEDPAPFVSLYQQRWESTDEALAQARAELVAVGGPDEVAAFDKVVEQVNEYRSVADAAMTTVLNTDKDSIMASAQEIQQQLRPPGLKAIVALEELANEQRGKLADEQAAADRAADAAECLRERRDFNVELAVQAEVIDNAAPAPTEHTFAVRVVNHRDDAVLLAHLVEFVERRNVAVHAEHTVGHE